MRYPLRNGHVVITRKIGEQTEFETRNPEGEVISNVLRNRAEARELVIGLRAAVCLRRM